MKVKTSVDRVRDAIDAGDYKTADALMNKYRRKFGNRHFTYWMRLMIKNGLWELGV